jgi:hypothetical protein
MLLATGVGAAALGVGMAGCLSVAVDQGSTSTGGTSPGSSISLAQSTHEYPSPAPPRESVSGTAATAVAAIEAFASTYINWTADTVAGRMRALAAQSIGRARSAMQLAAAQTANDYELQRGGIANSGTVEAVAPLRGQRDQYAVVTKELTTATNSSEYQGLAPAWHVAIATVSEVANGQWVVSGWQPEN